MLDVRLMFLALDSQTMRLRRVEILVWRHVEIVDEKMGEMLDERVREKGHEMGWVVYHPLLPPR